MTDVVKLFGTAGFSAFEVDNDYKPSFYISGQSPSLRPLSDNHPSTVDLVMRRER